MTDAGTITDAAADLAGLGPAGAQVSAWHVQTDTGFSATYAVVDYPAEVGAGWLTGVLSLPLRIDAAVHIEPLAGQAAAALLRRQRARLESTRRLDAGRGALDDPRVNAAADDAADLADRIGRGASRLFRAGVYLTVHAPTTAALADAGAQLCSAAAATLLDLKPVTFRHLQGRTSTLPLGVDELRLRRVFDTESLAAAFPFASNDLPAPLPGQPPASGGILYGTTTGGTGVVWWDRWSCDNHNSVIIARSGAGKSYLIKLEILRNLYQGVRIAVIDPEHEYQALAAHVDGKVVALGDPKVKVNPLQLPAGDRRLDLLSRRALFLHTLVSLMLAAVDEQHGTGRAGMDAAGRAALDRAILATYADAGITADPSTWQRPAPLLADLAAQLDTDPAATDLSTRLAPWVSGNWSHLFDAPDTTDTDSHLVVWSLRQLPDELRTVGTLLALDAIWRGVDQPTDPGQSDGGSGQRTLVVVDEAWLLMRTGEGAKFLLKMAKAARKRHAGLAVVTQDAADLLTSPLGTAVISNAATQILMRQAPQAIDAVKTAFGLTAGEARSLATLGRGQALLVSGASRVAFDVASSPAEHAIARSDARPTAAKPAADLGDGDDL
ncbi:VirB4 family type IV secretion system protein [Catellatospora paridis]|uniref:VirB4 family type IV secretion system protein n=1 Tax=Catellatospora paridis TaxID=1617086 RepID=UPI0012D486E2